MESQKDVPRIHLIARKIRVGMLLRPRYPCEQYEGIGRGLKKVTQGTTFLSGARCSVGRRQQMNNQKTVREKPTGTPKPAKNSYEYGALKSIKSKKNITGSKPFSHES